MSSWLRCLACLRGPSSADQSIRLHLLSCQHIVCEPCASKAQRPNAGPESIFCPVCRACPVRCLPLNNKLPKESFFILKSLSKKLNIRTYCTQKNVHTKITLFHRGHNCFISSTYVTNLCHFMPFLFYIFIMTSLKSISKSYTLGSGQNT